MNLEDKIKSTVRDIPDFPKEGILFKDITPVFQDATLCRSILDCFAERWKGHDLDAIAGIESRGFIFGGALAMMLGIPFIPIRKAGKLPYQTLQYSYDLEYGSATMELHVDALVKGDKVLIHDDILATGGTSRAASELIIAAGGEVHGFAFLIELAFLNGREYLGKFQSDIHSVLTYH